MKKDDLKYWKSPIMIEKMNLHGASTNPGSENSCAMFPDEDQGAQICHLVMMMMRIMVKTMMMIKGEITVRLQRHWWWDLLSKGNELCCQPPVSQPEKFLYTFVFVYLYFVLWICHSIFEFVLLCCLTIFNDCPLLSLHPNNQTARHESVHRDNQTAFVVCDFLFALLTPTCVNNPNVKMGRWRCWTVSWGFVDCPK